MCNVFEHHFVEASSLPRVSDNYLYNVGRAHVALSFTIHRPDSLSGRGVPDTF